MKPIELKYEGWGEIANANQRDLDENFHGYDRIRQIERASIRRFMEEQKVQGFLRGRVMDFGAGKEPYRDLVEGDYVPIGKGQQWWGHFDTVMCNQVTQYLGNPLDYLKVFRAVLAPRGHLVMTYATNWDFVEPDDLFRFTKSGMEKLLNEAGFTVLLHELRASVNVNQFRFPLGYGVVARRDGTAGDVAPSADQSATDMTMRLRDRKPFFYVRFGDGAIECIHQTAGRTCDGEQYFPALGRALHEAWDAFIGAPGVLLGDWLSASFDKATERTMYEQEWRALVGEHKPELAHFEALLLMRESPALLDFYRAVKADPRKKLYMGPSDCAPAARMLGARHLVTPMGGLFAQVDELSSRLMHEDFDILLFGAGMAGCIPVVRCWQRYPERTYIHLGSALDPLGGRGKTRKQQLTDAQARKFLRELL